MTTILSTPRMLSGPAHALGMARSKADAKFAARFAECLRDLGWEKLTQTELAERLGVNQPMAGRYLAGTSKPAGRKEEQIAEIFGVCCEWLRTGRGPKRTGRNEEDLLDMSALTPDLKAHLRRLAIYWRNRKPPITDRLRSATVIPLAKK